MSADDVAAITGRTFADSYAHFATRGVPDRTEIAPLLNAEIERRLEGSLLPFEDAYDAAEVLYERSVPMGVATSSSRARLDASLRIAGMEDWFGATAAGDEVNEGKPAPDVYVLAAERMGVDPTTCVAVEDTQVGVDAARAAGMFVVGLQRTAAPLQADAVLPRLIPAAVLREV